MIVRRFAQGFFAPWDGLRRLRHDRVLRRWAMLPLLVTAVTFTLSLLVAMFAAGKSYEAFASYALAWSPWLRYPAEALLMVTLLIACVLGAAMTALLLSKMIGGVLFGRLARAAEAGAGRQRPWKELSPWAEGSDAVRSLPSFVVGNLFLWGLDLVPGVGPTIGLPLTVLWNGWLLGCECLAYPFGLRGLRRQEVKNFAWEHRWETLGLGVSVFLLSLLPIIGWVGIVAGVVGSVSLRHGLMAKELPPAS